MAITVCRSLAAWTVALALGLLSSSQEMCATETPLGLSEAELHAALGYLPTAAPIAYLRCVSGLIPDSLTLVIGTREYLDGEGGAHASKLWVFAVGGADIGLVFQTDMDERVRQRGLGPDFRVGLHDVQFVDLEGDRCAEIIVQWDTAPLYGVSLVQYARVLYVIRYDRQASAFTEVAADQVVFNQYTEDALILDIDRDGLDEVLVFNEIWDPDTCVECPKRFTIDAWTMRDGQWVRDPAWNGGRSFETELQYSVRHGDLASLLEIAIAVPYAK